MDDRKLFETAANYLQTELFPSSDPVSQRTFAGLYRLVAKGIPVTIDGLGDSLGLDGDAVTEALGSVPPSDLQYDEAGRIVAFVGLSQAPTRHRFEFGGRLLFTWCAFDTLFLPRLLGGEARISSTCPISDAGIGMTVTADGLSEIEPAGTRMSFAMPDAESRCADLRGAFCNHVSFLASAEAGAVWRERNPGGAVLSLDDAFALGQLRNEFCFKDVLAGDTGRARAVR